MWYTIVGLACDANGDDFVVIDRVEAESPKEAREKVLKSRNSVVLKKPHTIFYRIDSIYEGKLGDEVTTSSLPPVQFVRWSDKEPKKQ